jgi:membrane-bound lytic murein transglycosylase D
MCMSCLKRATSCLGFLALLEVLIGCVPQRSQPLHHSFLAPTPKPSGLALKTTEPPVLEPALDLEDAKPAFLAIQSSSETRRAETLAREADWHFQAGRRYYLEGDEKAARREFDRATDLLLGAPDTPGLRAILDKKLDELVEEIHRLDLAGLGSADLGEPAFEKPPLEDIPQLTFPVDPKLKHKVLEEVRATVSQLPLQVNDEVLSYIKYFSSERGRKILIHGLQRAGRYRPLIQRVFDEEGVPQELIFLAQAESGFLPRAVSRARATGMWQFVLFRGREYGLVQSPYSDDRLDPEKSTRAAARHLRDLYQRYGDWYLAMAAYNCGPGTVDRAVERTGYADFWELRRRSVLPKETSNYVPIILAMTIITKNAREYGLESIVADPSLTYDTLEITAPTNLLLLADLAECPVSQIRDLNPALLKNVAPAGWPLRVPKGSGAQLLSVLGTVPAEKRCCWRAHRVGESESLAAIARRYRVTPGSIVAVNRATGASFRSGDLLVIPAVVREQPQTVSAKRVVHRRAVHRKTAPRKVATAAGPQARPAGRKHAAVAYSAANLPPASGQRRVVQR